MPKSLALSVAERKLAASLHMVFSFWSPLGTAGTPGTDGKESPVSFLLATEFTAFPMSGNTTFSCLPFMRLDGGLELEDGPGKEGMH